MRRNISPEILDRVIRKCVEGLKSGQALTREDFVEAAEAEGLPGNSTTKKRIELEVRREFWENLDRNLKEVRVGRTRVYVDPALPLEDTNFASVETRIRNKTK